MNISHRYFKKLGLLTGFLLIFQLVNAQDYKQLNHKIDSLTALHLPKSAMVIIDRLDSLARAQKNAPQQIKAAIYRMKFQSYMEENALVAIIERLKVDVKKADYPVKPVLQSLLGDMYWTYYTRNRFRYLQRTRVDKPDSDFTTWDLQTLISETDRQFQHSLQDINREQQTPITVLDGVLTGDTATRYLRPTLYDLLVQRALDFYLANETTLNKPKLPFTLDDPRLFAAAENFAALNISTTDTASILYKGFKYLQQATRFHLQQHHAEAVADLDLKRLEYLFSHATPVNLDSLYLKAIRQIASKFADRPISADAMVLMGRYYQQKDSLTAAVSYYTKAANSYPNSTGGKNGAGLLRQIMQKNLSALIENINTPGEPILGLINYQNVKAAHLVIYKISARQYNQLAAMPSPTRPYNDGTVIYPSDSALHYLEKLKPLKDEQLHLPNTQDYKPHSTEFKIDPLKSGNYVLILRDALSNDPGLVQLTSFKVNHLAFATKTDADGQVAIRVMDRKTGQPKAGVHVIMAERDENKVTDKNGACNLGRSNNRSYSLKLTTSTDTLYVGNRFIYNPFAGINKAAERTILFTDREIYRPGQTVYFKGILLTDVPKSAIIPNKALTVTFKDNNRKLITDMPVITNEYGSFSGSFIIPQHILNGSVSIRVGTNDKFLRVEEYKRPSFTMEFLPVTGNYKINDSVKIKGKVTAYSGYGISQARVAFRVQRFPALKDYRLYRKYASILYKNTEILTDTIVTDSKGRFEIKFKAIPNENIDNRQISYSFNINADATDASGETRSANTSVRVDNQNLEIQAFVPQTAFTHDTISFACALRNLNGVMQSGTLSLSVYALKQPDGFYKNRLWNNPGEYLIDSAQFKKDFPAYAYKNADDTNTWAVKNKVASQTAVNDGLKSSVFYMNELSGQPSGTYKVIITAKNSGGDSASVTRFVRIFNEDKPAKPQVSSDWVTLLTNNDSPASPARFLVGTGAKGYVLMERYAGTVLKSSQWINIKEDKQQVIEVPFNADEHPNIQFLTVYNNRLYTHYQELNQKGEDRLNIKFLTFRNKLQPGEKEQWKLQITNKNKEAQPAELLADLYDASLDGISSPGSWSYTTLTNRIRTLNPVWDRYDFAGQLWDQRDFSGLHNTYPLAYNNGFYYSPAQRSYEKLNMFGYNYYGGYNPGYLLFARVNGKDAKGDPNAAIRIDEPVGNSDIYIRGASTLMAYDEMPLREIVVPPGQKFSKEAILKSTREISGLGELNEVAVGYGGQAKRDVIGHLSADTVQYTADNYGEQAYRSIAIRKDFSETAFFLPQLHTDEDGQILIDFTIPESLTKWRFQAFAYTKDLQSGFMQQELVTQKQLSISANMPRFLRVGDTITVAARLANLTSLALTGKVQLQLFNALNMQPVNLLINPADAQQKFNLAAATNQAISFRIVIPSGLDALTYRITADAGKFADGEENTLPVLTNQTLVTEALPMMVRPGQTRTFTFDKLINQHSATLKSKVLTLEYTQNPAWYAVQALPYMMEFPYECSEQLFSRYYANSMATHLVNSLPAIKQVFDRWKNSGSQALLSNLEKNPELKSVLIEETPWLQSAQSESEQRQRIALLFDLNKMSYEMQLNLDKLQQKQLPDGGFPWFGGDRSDRYITTYILAGIGQLYHTEVVDNKDFKLKSITGKALNYLDNTLANDAEWARKHSHNGIATLSANEIYAYYACSYFNDRNINAETKELLSNYLNRAQNQWTNRGIYEQGLIALTMLRNKRPEIAKTVIRSLNETAQRSPEMGMYWAKNQPGCFWYQAPVETQSLMIELFTEAGNNDKAVEEMKIWLLRNKQTNNWRTTKATAAACYALLLKGANWINDTGKSAITLGGKPLDELKPALKAEEGTGYFKTAWADEQIKPALGKATIKNEGKTIAWGGLYWQYLENLDKITPSQTEIHLERKYFIQKQTGNGPQLTAVDARHLPKTGDLLKVVVYLKAGRDFEYVDLKDMRPAGTEPVDVLSAYKYQDGLYYYQVTKDVATHFFISNLNKGNYVFEYSLRVAQPGNFSTGISTIQSMYAPEFNAHSEGARLTVKP